MKTVVVNGTFDILHSGHIRLLNVARNMGDHLLVCIDSDRRVSALKGSARPINTQLDRKELLLNIKAVDQVEVFDTDEELISILKKYNPDIMVKGSDWKDKPIVGSQYVKHIEYFERLEEYATTKTIQNIINRG
jgi:D-beta-D-heptose 7-phosphate kinase/D-beta-D-heptose 1-phosphate adenosyltransferase